jgi:hypothetical protein
MKSEGIRHVTESLYIRLHEYLKIPNKFAQHFWISDDECRALCGLLNVVRRTLSEHAYRQGTVLTDGLARDLWAAVAALDRPAP